MVKQIFRAFEVLPLGIYRLNIVLNIVFSLWFASVEIDDHLYEYLGMLVFGFMIYWIFARIILWIYLGFKGQK